MTLTQDETRCCHVIAHILFVRKDLIVFLVPRILKDFFQVKNCFKSSFVIIIKIFFIVVFTCNLSQPEPTAKRDVRRHLPSVNFSYLLFLCISDDQNF